MKPYVHFWPHKTSQSILLWRRNFSDKICREIKTHILCSVTSSLELCHLWDDVKNYGTARQATSDNKIQSMRNECWITKATDTHADYVTLNAFPKPTMVTKTRLLVTFIRTLTALILLLLLIIIIIIIMFVIIVIIILLFLGGLQLPNFLVIFISVFSTHVHFVGLFFISNTFFPFVYTMQFNSCLFRIELLAGAQINLLLLLLLLLLLHSVINTHDTCLYFINWNVQFHFLLYSHRICEVWLHYHAWHKFTCSCYTDINNF